MRRRSIFQHNTDLAAKHKARSALKLDKAVGVLTAFQPRDTVKRFERGDELKERTIEALQRVLEVAGIEFVDGNGGVPGVRLSGKSSGTHEKNNAGRAGIREGHPPPTRPFPILAERTQIGS